MKTRLASVIGEEAAFAVYIRLLAKLRKTLAGVNQDIRLYYSDFADSEDLWENKNISRFVQKGSDIGLRMAQAFRETLESGYEKAILIGSDIWDLNPDDIREAFIRLDDADVVFGPAKDGGYYLIGMKKFHPAIFHLAEWSHSKVLSDSLKKCNELGLHTVLIRELRDIDEVNDLEGTDLI